MRVEAADGQFFRTACERQAELAVAVPMSSVNRNGKLSLALTGRPEKLPVSRLYAHLFKAM